VVHDILDDPTKTNATEASVPPQYFQLPKPTCGQYVRFQIISWYGNGGGLQYFSTCPLKCEDEYDLYLNKCYQLVQPQNDISWNDANFECNNRGGQLASIPNAEINDHISTLLSKETFIGLVKDGTADDEWAWTDGSPFDYVNFSPDSPSGGEFCGNMFSGSGEWNDRRCSTKYDLDFICQKYPTY